MMKCCIMPSFLSSFIFITIQISLNDAFSPSVLSSSSSLSSSIINTGRFSLTTMCSSKSDGEGPNEEGESLAADFFKTLQSRNIQLDESDLLDDDDDEDEDDEDDEDVGSVQDSTQDDNDKSSSISDNQVYSELNERVLETAGGFVDFVSKTSDDDDDDDENDEGKPSTPKVYTPPKTIPDPALTAGEVVMTVLEALNHNDNPSPDYGVEVLFGYSSSGSAISQAIDIEGMTPAEYATFLKEEYEYKILFTHDSVMIEKGDYSFDRKKAFFTARLSDMVGGDINVNFILSTGGQDEDDCWLIDSLLIRPEGMRRRRRR